MSIRHCFILFFLVSFISFSQENEFSKDIENENQERLTIEVAYPINFGSYLKVEGFARSNGFDSFYGIVDLGLKYTAKSVSNINIGFALTADYFRRKYDLVEVDNKYKQVFFGHLNFFSEFRIPKSEKFRFFNELGYTIVSLDNTIYHNNLHTGDIFDAPLTINKDLRKLHHGYNFKVGIQYFLSKKVYMQSYFHGSRIFLQDFFNVSKNFGVNLTQIKVGLGVKL